MSDVCSLVIAVGPACGVISGTASSVASHAATSVTSDFVATAATDAANAADSLLKTLSTAWVQVATPNLSDGSASGTATTFLQGHLEYITLWLGVASMLVAAARMAWSRRADPVREAFTGLFRLMLVSAAGVAAVDLLGQVGDAFSNWILNQATHGGSGLTQATNLFNLTSASGGPFSPVPFLLLILAIIAILASLVQLALLLVRGALLVVLGGTWPLAAAASMTQTGNSWFKKQTGWLLAFLLYKPAAAVCYAAAFQLIGGSGSGSAIAEIEGIVLIIMATLTLPALLKFVVPAVSAAGGVGAAEAVTAGAALATGATAITATAGGLTAAGAAGRSWAGPSGVGGSANGGGPSGGKTSGGDSPAPSPAGPARGGAEPVTVGAPRHSSNGSANGSAGPPGSPGLGGGGGSSGGDGAGGRSGSPGGGGRFGDVARGSGAATEGASGAVRKSMGDEDE